MMHVRKKCYNEPECLLVTNGTNEMTTTTWYIWERRVEEIRLAQQENTSSCLFTVVQSTN